MRKDEMAENLLEMVITQYQHLFCRGNLEYLDQIGDDFKQDTGTESFIYFKNCFVRITSEGFQHINMKSLINRYGKTRYLSTNFMK